MHSATGVGEAAFADEKEFRLFVEATVGLGPEQAFRNSPHSPSSPSRRWRSTSDELNSRQHRRYTTEQTLSPSEGTLSPSTARALQGLSHIPDLYPSAERRGTMTAFQEVPIMPESLERPPARRGTLSAYQEVPQMFEPSRQPLTHSQSARRPLQTSSSGLDLWLSSQGGAPPTTADLSPIDMEEEDELPPGDDELPDYASSQAQVQAAQRVEATRRAQELQRRWQASGGARG
jgi:hypothetical protein